LKILYFSVIYEESVILFGMNYLLTGGPLRKQFVFLTIFFSLLFIFFTTSSFAKPMNILVHPFENTGNKAYSWISAGMTDTVIADLARIKNISVVSNTDRKKILEEMKFIFSGLAEEDKMIKLGKLTGANVIFTGSYLVSGERIRVHARLVNVETGKIESTAKIDGTLGGIFELQDKVVFNLMGETEKIQIADVKPVRLTSEDKKTIEEKPKPKSSAYEWYAKGLEIQDTNPREALANFKKAIAIDPGYTAALMGAGYTAGNTLNLFDEGLGYLERAEKRLKDRNETSTVDEHRPCL
jgi:TolB-like protein